MESKISRRTAETLNDCRLLRVQKQQEERSVDSPTRLMTRLGLTRAGPRKCVSTRSGILVR